MDRNRNILGLTIITLLLTSCSLSGSQQSPIKSNRITYTVDCSGAASSMSVCYDKAQTLCPDGYIVISKQESQIAPIGNTLLTRASTGNPAANLRSKRDINIECR